MSLNHLFNHSLSYCSYSLYSLSSQCLAINLYVCILNITSSITPLCSVLLFLCDFDLEILSLQATRTLTILASTPCCPAVQQINVESWLFFVVWAACPLGYPAQKKRDGSNFSFCPIWSIKLILSSLAFLVAAPTGSPNPKVRWFKNGLEIHPEQPDFSVARDGALVISAASASHSGDFKCVAVNEAGSVERKTRLKVNGENLCYGYFPAVKSIFCTYWWSINLSFCAVLVPPEIQDNGQPLNLTVTLKQPLTLGCDAFGIPSPTITWTKDGKAVSVSSWIPIYRKI